MTSLRAFARTILLVCLVLFAVAFVAPSAAFAKVYRADGGDSIEGDPGDGVASSGGGSLPSSPNTDWSEVPVSEPRSSFNFLQYYIISLPGSYLGVLLLTDKIVSKIDGGGR